MSAHQNDTRRYWTRWHVTAATLTVILVCVASGVHWATAGQHTAAGPPPDWADFELMLLPNGARGWYASPAKPTATVLLLHGIRSTRRSMTSRARFLFKANYAVAMIDLHGHGETPGRRLGFGAKSTAHARDAIQYLRIRHPDNPVFAIGFSMGGATALLAEPALDVDGMVLEAVYPSIDKALENRLRRRLGAIGQTLTPLLLSLLEPTTGIDADSLSPIRRISEVRIPLLIISGREDVSTTVEDTEALFEAANEPKSLWIVPGAGHINLHKHQPSEYERRVLHFFYSIEVRPVIEWSDST